MERTDGARVTRRMLLGAAVAGLAAGGCSTRSPQPPPPKPPDPQTVLLISLIRDKERLITLYQQAALDPKKAPAVEAFRLRHADHLAALRELLPKDDRSGGTTPDASPSGSPSPTAGPRVTIGKLRDAERRAAAARPGQMVEASPVLAQLLASIGACEAVHAVALGRLRD